VRGYMYTVCLGWSEECTIQGSFAFSHPYTSPHNTPPPPTAPFSVDPLSGNLVLMQTIDFETRNNYTFNVAVMDGDFPTLYDSALVTIYIEDVNDVEDVNDNHPSFNAASYSADILEADYSISPMRIAIVILCLL